MLTYIIAATRRPTAILGHVVRSSPGLFRFAGIGIAALCALTATTSTASGQTIVEGQTVSLTYEVTIQPIYIQNGSGSIAVKTNYESLFLPSNSDFKVATQRIWAQAGVKITWLTPVIFSSATYYAGVPDQATLDALLADSGNMKSSNKSVLNLWFYGPSASILGNSQQTIQNPANSLTSATFKNGVTVSESVFSGGHYDTIAHEIGHNLGLTHYLADNSTPVPAKSLMAEFAVNGVGLTDLYPFGSDYYTLSSREITLVQSIPTSPAANAIFNPVLVHTIPAESYTFSSLAIPEPAEYAGIFGLLVGAVAMRRKRTARVSERGTS